MGEEGLLLLRVEQAADTLLHPYQVSGQQPTTTSHSMPTLHTPQDSDFFKDLTKAGAKNYYSVFLLHYFEKIWEGGGEETPESGPH